MLYNIYNQVTGAFVTNGSTKQPIIVELNVDKDNVRNTFKDEQELIVSFYTGEELIIQKFFDKKGMNKLVIKESNGNYSEIIPSELNDKGLFEVVDYNKIENFADYLYQASVATSGMDWIDAAIVVGAVGIGAGVIYENRKDSHKNDDQKTQESPNFLSVEKGSWKINELQDTKILNLLIDLSQEDLNVDNTWENVQVDKLGVDPDADMIDVRELLSDDETLKNIADYIQIDYNESTQIAIISTDWDGKSSQYTMTEYLKLTNLENTVALEDLLQNYQIIF